MHARARRRRCLQQLQRQLLRDRQQHARTDLALLFVRALRFRHQHPRALRIDRPANPELQVGIDAHRRLGLDQRPRRLVHLPVDDETERALRRCSRRAGRPSSRSSDPPSAASRAGGWGRRRTWLDLSAQEACRAQRDRPIDVLRHHRIGGRRLIGAALLQRGERVGVAAVADRDGQVAPQAGELRARHRAALRRARAGRCRTARQSSTSRGRFESACAAATRASADDRRRLVVRADFLADVAAVDVIAERGAMLVGNAGSQLDREVRDAARRVEHAGSTSAPVGHASRQRRHAAALLERLRVGLERQACVMISARNSQEPCSALIRHVFLPIQPRPAYCA